MPSVKTRRLPLVNDMVRRISPIRTASDDVSPWPERLRALGSYINFPGTVHHCLTILRTRPDHSMNYIPYELGWAAIIKPSSRAISLGCEDSSKSRNFVRVL